MTVEITEERGMVGGQRVCVVDTPGIMDPQKDQEIRAYCEDLRRSGRPHVFLFVLKIDRFTGEQEEALRRAVRAAGDQSQRRGLLLFTGADSLGDMTLDQFIHEDPDNPLVSLVQPFGDRIHMFNNSPRSQKNQEKNQEQVLELMEKIRQMTHEGRRAPVGPGSEQTPQTETEELHRLEEVRLVLLGLPGAGKSSTGNTILGSQQFESCCSFNPVTTESLSGSAEVDGRRVTVVDTPGFSDKPSEPWEVFEQLVGCVEKAGEPGLNAFVIVVPLGRISEADCWFFTLISLLFDTSQNYLTVLFTHGDQLEGKTVDVDGNAAVKELVSKCGGRYCVFNNKQRGDLRQVQELFRILDRMNSENNGQKYTEEVLIHKQQSLMDNPSELNAFRHANGIPELPEDSSDRPPPSLPSLPSPSSNRPTAPPSSPTSPRTNRQSRRPPGSPPSPKKKSWSFFRFIGSIFIWIYENMMLWFLKVVSGFFSSSESSSTQIQTAHCSFWGLNNPM